MFLSLDPIAITTGLGALSVSINTTCKEEAPLSKGERPLGLYLVKKKYNSAPTHIQYVPL